MNLRLHIPFLMIVLSLIFSACNVQQKISSNFETSKTEIEELMKRQAMDWGTGDLDAFMNGYLKSDSLVFVGRSGITYGWEQTLQNYKKGYPTKDHTGILTFNLLKFDQLADDVFFVIGEYQLKRSIGNANGMFSVILKRIKGEWKIVADHSSSSS